jgi:hypothetical protein
VLHGLQSSNHHCQKSVQKHLQKKPQMTKTAIFVTAALLAGYTALRKITELYTNAEVGTYPK